MVFKALSGHYMASGRFRRSRLVKVLAVLEHMFTVAVEGFLRFLAWFWNL